MFCSTWKHVAGLTIRLVINDHQGTQRFDGDTGSGTTVYTKEGIEEIDKFFLSKQAYVDTNNKLYDSADVELNSLVFWNMTRQQPA